MIDEATNFETHGRQGRKPDLEFKQKVIIFLLKELFGKSNRMMVLMFAVFSLLSGIDVSYKTVERFHFDPDVEIVVRNIHILISRNCTTSLCRK